LFASLVTFRISKDAAFNEKITLLHFLEEVRRVALLLFTPENQQLTLIISLNIKKSYQYFFAFFSGLLGARSSG